MTFKERLEEVNVKLERIAGTLSTNLSDKGVTPDPSGSLEVFAGQVADIEQGGTTGEWQPDPLWWDYKAITESELNRIPGYKPAAFILLQDQDITTVLSYAGTGTGTNARYKTSDGYEGVSYTHTWDRTKDKLDSSGAYTRYIMVFTPDATPNISFSGLNTIRPLGIYCKYRHIVSMAIGSSTDNGTPCQFIDIGETTTVDTLCSGTYWGGYLRNLQYLTLPKNLTTIGAYFLNNAYSFNQPIVGVFPSLTSIGSSFLYGCSSFNQPIVGAFPLVASIDINFLYNNHSFNQPIVGAFPLATSIGATFLVNCYKFNQSIDNAFPSLTSLGADILANSYAFNNILVYPHLPEGVTLTLPATYNMPRRRGVIITSPLWSRTSVNFTDSTMWTQDTLLDFYVNLPDNTGSTVRTITLGTTNLAKSPAEHKLIATNKNYTLN